MYRMHDVYLQVLNAVSHRFQIHMTNISVALDLLKVVIFVLIIIVVHFTIPVIIYSLYYYFK